MLIQATVKTSQKKFFIVKKSDSNWSISVKSPPEHNKANIEIIKELFKEYKHVRIIKGLKSSKKVIEVL